jgi:N utilization substance protein B
LTSTSEGAFAVWRDDDGSPAGSAPKTRVGRRRLARAVAVQALYESDITGHPAVPIAGRLADDAQVGPADREFAVGLVTAVEENRVPLDEKLGELAPTHPVALAELEYKAADTPEKVVVNEAVELATLFGAESSQKFVNGVLGTVLG